MPRKKPYQHTQHESPTQENKSTARISNKLSFKNRFLKAWAIIDKFWKFPVFLTVVSGLFVFRDQIHDWTTPREKLWKERTYINGINIPSEITKEYNGFTIVVGGSNGKNYGVAETFLIDQLADTVLYNPTRNSPIITPGGDAPFNFRFLLKKNRLYIATLFTDIDDKYVGKMNFNKFELKSSKISNYHDGDDNMEIIDENNFVLFNMKYVYPNIIVINGYFVGNNGVQIASDSGFAGLSKFLPDYKQQAIHLIQNIKPLNAY